MQQQSLWIGHGGWKSHSFWRELPNYNPVTVESSTPGVDHAGEVIALFDAPGGEEGDMFGDNGGAELGADEGKKYDEGEYFIQEAGGEHKVSLISSNYQVDLFPNRMMLLITFYPQSLHLLCPPSLHPHPPPKRNQSYLKSRQSLVDMKADL